MSRLAHRVTLQHVGYWGSNGHYRAAKMERLTRSGHGRRSRNSVWFRCDQTSCLAESCSKTASCRSLPSINGSLVLSVSSVDLHRYNASLGGEGPHEAAPVHRWFGCCDGGLAACHARAAAGDACDRISAFRIARYLSGPGAGVFTKGSRRRASSKAKTSRSSIGGPRTSPTGCRRLQTISSAAGSR